VLDCRRLAVTVACTDPPLTTNDISTRKLGSAAWWRLEEKSSDGDDTGESGTVRRLPFELVVRASTATPAVRGSSAGRPRRPARRRNTSRSASYFAGANVLCPCQRREARPRKRRARESHGARPSTGGWRRRRGLAGRRVAPPLRTCGPCGSKIYDDEPCGSAVGGQSDERERQRPSTPAIFTPPTQAAWSPAPKATLPSCRRPCRPR
jgi:hypothetical protein